jgi:predicted metal-dependent peptidase
MRTKEQPQWWKETVNAMSVMASPYSRDYVFYMHMLSQCSVFFTDEVPTAAVTFKRDHYELLLNPEFMEPLPIEQRLGVIKHEQLHILNGHLTFQLDLERNMQSWNYATDCAINQMITGDHLPQGCILPASFPSKKKCPDNLSAVQYYDFLEDNKDESKMPQSGEGDREGGDGAPTMDDHSTWQDSEGDPQIAKDLAKSMAEKSADATQKSSSPGTIPSEYSDWINLLSTKREVDWKKVLRNIVGNKKANRRKTILRRDRRSPHFEHIKGKTKDRVFELLVVCDVSGSVSDSDLQQTLPEICSISKLTNTPTSLIQVDTQPCEPEKIKAQITRFERKASGGTQLAPALTKADECGLKYDALVVITDGYLFNDDINPFRETGKKVIWLITPDGQIMDEMNEGKMMAIRLKDKSKE